MRVVEILVPPDKSISHRAIMLASISEGTTRIKNLLMADDCLRTIEAFCAMGVEIDTAGSTVTVRGKSMHGLKKPCKPLYLGNSGTTMRLLPGILAGQDFEVVLEGDRSLSSRPMRRIVEPLRKMGADIASFPLTLSPKGRGKGEGELYPPLRIRGGRLKAIRYKSKIASAQVKSCILLAGLFADGVTSVTEPMKSRDHTERMLKLFDVKLFSTRSARSKNIVRARPKAESRTINLKGPVKLKSPGVIEIPGDISSAAFFIVAGCILPETKLVLENVGLNPSRTGILDILKKMKADIQITPRTKIFDFVRVTSHEPCGDIIVKSSKLKGLAISPQEVVRAIDEIPIIMVAACFAKGETVIRGIDELRLKETDRIKSMVTNLKKLGAEIYVEDKVVIKGSRPLHGGRVSSYGDHRTAMSMLIAGLAIKDKVTVTGLDCINKSFPGFPKLLQNNFTLKTMTEV